MSTEPIVQKEKPVSSSINPFARQLEGHVNAGTVAVESERAIAEAQGKLVIAKRFPRDQAHAYVNIIEACKRPGLAEEACYSFPRGGEVVSGPTIRLAEMLAANWGNVDYGIRELSRKEGVSEMEAYCWDLETNTMSSQKFTVRHIRDTRGGGRPLTDERDIYELTANMGARRLRARILAILPADLVQAAVDQCSQTLANGGEVPMADRIRGMLAAFKKLGIPAALIEKRIGHSLDNVTGEELADLRKIHNSIRDNMSAIGDWFGEGKKDEDVPYDAPPERPAAPPRAKRGAAAVVENAKAQQQAPIDVTTAPVVEKPVEPPKTEAAPKVEPKVQPKPEAPKSEAAPAAEPAPATPAPFTDGEVRTCICTVRAVEGGMLNYPDSTGAVKPTPSVSLVLAGDYEGNSWHPGGGEGTSKENVKPLPIYSTGAVLKFTLRGRKNKATTGPLAGRVAVIVDNVELPNQEAASDAPDFG